MDEKVERKKNLNKLNIDTVILNYIERLKNYNLKCQNKYSCTVFQT